MRFLSTPFAMILSALLSALAAPAGEAAYQASKPPSVKRATNLETTVIGVLHGSNHEAFVREKYPAAAIRNYADTARQVAALLAGEVEAVVTDEPVARSAAADNPLLAVLSDMLATDQYALALRFYWDDMLADVNRAIAELRSEGILEEMAERWIDGPKAGRVMPDIPLVDDKPPLIVAVSPALPPMLYTDAKGEPTGFDIELLRRVAVKISHKLVLREMPFDKLLPTLRAGDAHIAAACLTITPERKEFVRFTTPYYTGGVAVLTGKRE